jgi:hypothetical protein
METFLPTASQLFGVGIINSKEFKRNLNNNLSNNLRTL